MNAQRATCNGRRSERGFTLIEVLLAIALFAIGMLALAGMFAGQMVGHAMGRNMTEATAAAQDWLEQIYDISPVGNVDGLDGEIRDCRFGQPGEVGWNCTPLAGGGGACPPVDRPYRRTTTVQVNPAGFPAINPPAGFPATNTRLVTITVQWCDDIGALHNVVVSGLRSNNDSDI